MTAERRVIGAVLVDLVKFVVKLEKAQGPQGLSVAAHAAISARINLNVWYDLALFLELLRVLDRAVIKGSERRALEMGAAGGAAMRGPQKAYVVGGDPKSSVLAMRHAWRAHYSFGRLLLEIPTDKKVSFRVEQYADIPMVHAMICAGWGVAAARAAGSRDARATIITRPWLGERDLAYNIEF